MTMGFFLSAQNFVAVHSDSVWTSVARSVRKYVSTRDELTTHRHARQLFRRTFHAWKS
jgi:hypothetical protein